MVESRFVDRVYRGVNFGLVYKRSHVDDS